LLEALRLRPLRPSDDILRDEEIRAIEENLSGITPENVLEALENGLECTGWN